MADLHDYGTGEAPKPPRPDYVPKVHVFPQTLDELMQRAGPYADAAKAHVEWSAVSVWLMKVSPNPALAAAFITEEAASLSVLLTRHAAEHEANWPKLSDNPVSPALYDLPEDAQNISRHTAASIFKLWEDAGRPHLKADDYRFAFQYLVAAIRKGIIPPVPTIGDVSR